MKLLRVIATVDPATGGPVSGLRAVTPALSSLGHETEFLTVDSATAPFLDSWVGRVHALGPVNNRYARSPRLKPWLEKNIGRYDAVVVHGLWQDFGRVVRTTCRERGNPPYFVFPHGMLDPALRKTYPVRHFKKWLYWQLIERRVLRDARAVLFTCEEERRLARLSFPRYQCMEEVITYGTDVPDTGGVGFAPAWQARCPSAMGRHFWLFLGRVHSKKGVDLLLQAYAAVRKAIPESRLPGFPDLVIAGPCLDAGYLTTLKKIADDEKITPFIHWAGMLTGDAKWGALQSAEAFILPSHQENFGIAVVEALACGKPVLISNCVNIWRELVADGAALVESDDLNGVKRLFQRWLELPVAARSAMATAAVQSFRKRFEITHAAETFATQLAGLLNQPKPANH
jgi:glycosyltransferase involved in cell wall biosynthesis